MDTPNVWVLMIEVCLMAFGYSWRKKGYEISSDLAFSIGFLGIFISVFHTKLYFLLNKICTLLSIGTLATETNNINPYFIIFTLSLFLLLVSCITVLSSVFIPIKKSNDSKKVRALLFLEMDHNLKTLQDFWNELWGWLEIAPTSIIDQVFEKTRQVVISEDQFYTKKVITKRTNLHSTNFPTWHHKIFDKPTSLDDLLCGEQQSVRQFYDNLEDITSMYEELRSYRATDLISKCESRLKGFIKKVLEQSNPLKTPNQSLEPTIKIGSLS